MNEKNILKHKRKGVSIIQLTIKIKLIPTIEQIKYINSTLKEYINTVNKTASFIIEQNSNQKLSSNNVIASLPSALKNQAIRDSKSIYSKYKKTKKQSILKKAVAIWNNQNYKVLEDTISLPMMIDGKSKRINIKASITPKQQDQLNNKLGTLRITKINGKLVAQIAVEVEEKQVNEGQVMGVDLGLKIPAVAVCENGKTKFSGNGRKNKYKKRIFRSKRRELGKAKKQSKINSLNNKEQRYMKDEDHKVSRQIVNFAVKNNVSVIRMEELTNIRDTARTSRKNEKNLHTWSFYRLAGFIEYKAQLEGIKIEYVDPKYTSQTCPNCGKRNHANDRKYKCSCGFKAHRDRVGAINITSAPVVSGKGKSA